MIIPLLELLVKLPLAVPNGAPTTLVRGILYHLLCLKQLKPHLCNQK